MKKEDSRILVISDLHIPYHHKDAFAFLKQLKKEFKPTRIISIGDEVDNHGISFHDSDPDVLSCSELERIFPKMDLVDSNHGSLAYRKAKAKGIPLGMIRSYNDILEVGPGWKWQFEILVKIHARQDILFRHQFQQDILKTVNQMGCSCVQGHHHSTFDIRYSSNPRSLNWGLTVGCLIDSKALAFEYNKLQVKRPILGVGLIENGLPKLVPMILNGKGRWVKKIY
jgi:hypothetical protein